jgi:methylenetetrahydrofolate reductase (NADPH)
MWGEIYEGGSEAAELIKGIAGEWYLVNVVDNDYREGNARIFDVFAGAVA